MCESAVSDSWRYMDFNGFECILTNFDGSKIKSLILMDYHLFSWILMDLDGFGWILMDMDGSGLIWIDMDMDIWIRMNGYMDIWICGCINTMVGSDWGFPPDPRSPAYL